MIDQHSKWKEVNGDETFALDWKIKSSALVWEIGGFEGRWAAQMAEKYDPWIEIFEPQGWAVERLQKRFAENQKFTIKPYGLWVMQAALPLYNFETDGASLLAEGVRSQVCNFMDVYKELHSGVDVCLMNIEGAEFVLLPYLIGYDLMRYFRYFWCQFHTFVPGSEKKIVDINKGMAKTHKVLWDFYPTAVAWERRD